MTDEQVIKVPRFIVLSAHAVKESEAFLAEKFGPDIGLSEKGYEMIFSECAKETLLVVIGMRCVASSKVPQSRKIRHWRMRC